MIFESHAHYDDERFDSDRVELLSFMPKKNIERIINVGSTLNSSRKSIELAKEYDFIYAAIGVHPSDISCFDEEENGLDWLYETAKKEKKVVSIGEIGFDFYWDKEEENHRLQKHYFLEQLEIARKLDLPVIIHSRDAAADTLDMIKEANLPANTIDIHCFSYSKEMAREYLNMGYYIGVGGVVTFKNAKKLKEVVEYTPIENILLETDCPYLAPEPNRGKRNSSLNLPYVVEKIAEIKNMSVEDVISITERNAFSFYRMR